jgi:hypothetical protein
VFTIHYVTSGDSDAPAECAEFGGSDPTCAAALAEIVLHDIVTGVRRIAPVIGYLIRDSRAAPLQGVRLSGALVSLSGGILKLIENLADGPARRVVRLGAQQRLEARDVHSDDERIVVGHSNLRT